MVDGSRSGGKEETLRQVDDTYCPYRNLLMNLHLLLLLLLSLLVSFGGVLFIVIMLYVDTFLFARKWVSISFYFVYIIIV